MEKRYGLGVKAAILSIIVTQYTITLQTPILGTINAEYGETYGTFIKQLETLNTLSMVVVGLLMGLLLKFMGRKKLLIIATILAMLQALPAFIPGFWIIAAARICAGLGMGIIYPSSAAYVMSLFKGDEANKLMGIRSTTGAIAGIVVMQLSGLIATHFNYRFSYLIALIALPCVILMIAKIPNVEEEQASLAGSGEKKGSFTPSSWILLISGGILVMLFAYTYMTNCSIVVCSAPEDGGLGLSASVASTVLTVMSVAFAVCGLLYGAFFVRVFQQYTTVFAVLLLGIGLIIAYFAESFAMMCLASVVFGLGFPMFNDAIVQALGRTVRRENAIPVITSYFFAVSGIGQYLSSLVTPAISAALFPGNIRGDWLVSAVCLAAGAVVACIIQIVVAGKKKAA